MEITIELASVNTLIPIRNERMQAMLFETNLFPEGKIEAQIDLDALTAMSAGTSETMQLNFSLSMHDTSRSYTAEVKVTRLDEGLVASTLKPIVVTAEEFGLQSGVEALREVAGLPSISPCSTRIFYRGIRPGPLVSGEEGQSIVLCSKIVVCPRLCCFFLVA